MLITHAARRTLSLLWISLGLAGCAAAPPRSADPLADGLTDGLGMAFVRIPAGSFVMGNAFTLDELARDFPSIERARLEGLAEERPAHRVRITRDFYMARHEVTVGQFRRFVQARAC